MHAALRQLFCWSWKFALTAALLVLSACNSDHRQMVTIIKPGETARCYFQKADQWCTLDEQQIEGVNAVIRASTTEPRYQRKKRHLGVPADPFPATIYITDSSGQVRMLHLAREMIMSRAGEDIRFITKRDNAQLWKVLSQAELGEAEAGEEAFDGNL